MRVDGSYGEAGDEIDESLNRSSTCHATSDEDREGLAG